MDRKRMSSVVGDAPRGDTAPDGSDGGAVVGGGDYRASVVDVTPTILYFWLADRARLDACRPLMFRAGVHRRARLRSSRRDDR
jgi:hypothetical protein